MNAEQTLLKMSKDNLDMIYKTCEESVFAFDKNADSIPVVTVSLVLKNAKLKVKFGLTKPMQFARKYAMNYNKMLQLMNKTVIANAQAHGTNNISLKALKDFIEQIKS